MNVSLSISGIEGLNAMKAFLDPKGYERAMKAGVSYAAKAVPPAAGKAISSRYSITSSRVKESVGGITIRDGDATVVFKRKPPTAMQFRPRQNSTGVAYRLYRGATVQVPNAYIGSARGRQMVLMPVSSRRYKGDLGSGRAKPRAGLDFVHGPSIGSLALGRARFAKEIQKELGQRINQQFIRGVERELGRQARGFGRR
jgi:hypothetical protein